MIETLQGVIDRVSDDETDLKLLSKKEGWILDTWRRIFSWRSSKGTGLEDEEEIASGVGSASANPRFSGESDAIFASGGGGRGGGEEEEGGHVTGT